MARKLALLLTLICGATAVADERYIVVFKPHQASTPTGAEITALGGRVHHTLPDQLVITIPEAAVAGLRHHPGVKYLQRVNTEILFILPNATAAPAIASSHAASGDEMMVDDDDLVVAGDGPGGTWDSGTYFYDPAGNITGQCGTLDFAGNCTAWVTKYTYDSLSRLKKATIGGTWETYTYDTFGNLINREQPAPAGAFPASIRSETNQLTRSGTSTYDSGGSFTGNPTGTRYAHDAFGLMTQRVDGGVQDYYVYTASDERIGTRSADNKWRCGVLPVFVPGGMRVG